LRKEEDDKNKVRRISTKPLTEFPVGSYVLLSYPDDERPKTRLDTIWTGPYLVQAIKSSQYTILNLVSDRTARVHVSRLKLFKYDPNITKPKIVARRDNNSFIVERVLEHTGIPNKKSDMDFLVRWLGYGQRDDLWLPWKELRDNNALHKYLHDHAMDKIIPIEHRKDNYDYSAEEFLE
jgi:hypothetical protein